MAARPRLGRVPQVWRAGTGVARSRSACAASSRARPYAGRRSARASPRVGCRSTGTGSTSARSATSVSEIAVATSSASDVTDMGTSRSRARRRLASPSSWATASGLLRSKVMAINCRPTTTGYSQRRPEDARRGYTMRRKPSRTSRRTSTSRPGSSSGPGSSRRREAARRLRTRLERGTPHAPGSATSLPSKRRTAPSPASRSAITVGAPLDGVAALSASGGARLGELVVEDRAAARRRSAGARGARRPRAQPRGEALEQVGRERAVRRRSERRNSTSSRARVERRPQGVEPGRRVQADRQVQRVGPVGDGLVRPAARQVERVARLEREVGDRLARVAERRPTSAGA